jgi:hypothetical protein
MMSTFGVGSGEGEEGGKAREGEGETCGQERTHSGAFHSRHTQIPRCWSVFPGCDLRGMTISDSITRPRRGWIYLL